MNYVRINRVQKALKEKKLLNWQKLYKVYFTEQQSMKVTSMSDANFDPSKIKILIVDDILANIEVLHETLEPEGYVISAATHGKMALEVALHLKPDLVLLDIMMPGMDGYETCLKLKENESTRDFPVIFISAKGEAGDIVEGFRVGGVDYITKPFHGEEVLSRVKTHTQLHYLNKLQKKRIQELELQNNKLEKLDEIKNRFIGTAMHDLRNPLSSISGFSDLFLRSEESYSEEEKKNLVNIINQTSKDLLGLVHDLLDISVFESGELNLNLSSGNLSAVLMRQVQVNQNHSDQKNITIVTSLKEVPDSIFDSNRIGQVIGNLISNALKFSQQGTSIEIGLSNSEQNLEFYVKDEGPGIAKKDQSRLFTEFPKISVYPTGGEKSTGLGLSIVKKIVDAHSGSIQVESEEGQGTKFHVKLPHILTRSDSKSVLMFKQNLTVK